MLCTPGGLTIPRADIYRILSPDNWWSDILPAGATVGYRDKNILNTDLLRLCCATDDPVIDLSAFAAGRPSFTKGLA